MATCEPIMIYLSDLEIIDKMACERATGIDLDTRENRKTLIQLRKDVLHDIIKKIPHREEFDEKSNK